MSTRLSLTMVLAAALTARAAAAQLPGLPLFQGAFAGPGLGVGVNVGRGDGRTMTAAAVGYGSSSGRVGLVAGLGAFNATAPGYRGSHLGYGARFALTVVRLAGEKLAVTPFVGFGSTRATLASGALAGLPAATPADTGTVIRNDALPIGVAAGWRFRLGAANALAVSVAPTYVINRRSGGSLDATNNTLRVAGVVELAVARRFGLTFSSELGKRAEAADPGPRGTRVGLGASFAFARR